MTPQVHHRGDKPVSLANACTNDTSITLLLETQKGSYPRNWNDNPCDDADCILVLAVYD